MSVRWSDASSGEEEARVLDARPGASRAIEKERMTVTRERRVGRAWPALDDGRGDALSSTMSVRCSDASSREEEARVMDARPGASERIDKA
jgi:hypothetical protein